MPTLFDQLQDRRRPGGSTVEDLRVAWTRYTFDRFVREAAQTVAMDDHTPLATMIRQLAGDPMLPVGIRTIDELERYACIPGSATGPLGDWSQPSHSELVEDWTVRADELWQLYLQWRRQARIEGRGRTGAPRS